MSATGASKHAPSDSLQSMHLVSKAAGLTALEIGAAFDRKFDVVALDPPRVSFFFLQFFFLSQFCKRFPSHKYVQT